MQQRLFLCMAVLCITAIPAFYARSLDNERELMELAIQALESNQGMSAEDSMVMQSGAYGAANTAGAYGGILEEPTTSTPAAPSIPATSALESGEASKPAAVATPSPAPSAKKSSAVSAQQSAGLLAAGLMAAVFLL